MKVFNTCLSAIVTSLAFVALPAMAAVTAHPGMLNYVEGQARINGQTVTSANVGTADVGEGQVIETGNGKAEILLTPGVFLRLDSNSSVRMDSAGLIDTRVAILNGRAMVEADNLQKGNNIRVLDDGAVTRLEKNGIYRFTAKPGLVATFDGKAQVDESDRTVDIGKGHETQLASLQSTKFDRKASENDPLYQWSNVRSEYLAEANVDQAQTLMMNNALWSGPGWYWDPWFDMYSWIPGDGLFWSPFGWGFFSPFVVWQAPYYGYRGFGGYRGGHVIVPAGRPGFHAAARSAAPAFGGGGFGGFRGGAMPAGRVGGMGMGRAGGGRR